MSWEEKTHLVGDEEVGSDGEELYIGYKEGRGKASAPREEGGRSRKWRRGRFGTEGGED